VGVVLIYFIVVVALGAGSSELPGPCRLSVINAVCRGQMRRAVRIGAGAGLGDATFAALGIVGLGAFLAHHPAVPPVLQACGGVALIVHGALHLRPRPVSTQPVRTRGGIGTGLAIVMSNPAAFVTWVIVVGPFLRGAGWAAIIGIGVGSFGWQALVAHLTRHGTSVLGPRTARIATVVSVLLVAGGALSIGRVLL
jgi:threonine/homoserine/homoserine lactone efflux protein